MMISLDETPQGILLPVQAQPKARKNGIVGLHAGRLKVAVTEAPDKGKANAALAVVLADSLGLKRSQIELISGETSTSKRFRISGISRDDLQRRIVERLEES